MRVDSILRRTAILLVCMLPAAPGTADEQYDDWSELEKELVLNCQAAFPGMRTTL